MYLVNYYGAVIHSNSLQDASDGEEGGWVKDTLPCLPYHLKGLGIGWGGLVLLNISRTLQVLPVCVVVVVVVLYIWVRFENGNFKEERYFGVGKNTEVMVDLESNIQLYTIYLFGGCSIILQGK